uniref:Ribosomal protein S4 n=1 Tax=Trebouxia lynnae TaxID=1825957 RepID=A0A5J6DU05_9CHLO|nr:ribosomal protein S4 [Trebouxia lynnae]
MLKKPLNKKRYPFLQASFPENPFFFKKLNRKTIKLNRISNKKGLTNRIRKIQKNIIEQETVTKIKNTLSTQNYGTVENLQQIHNFIKPDLLKHTKNKTNTTDKSKKPDSVISKYTFSLEQLKQEFYKKQSQYSKSSVFKTLLEERKKCSIVYGCLNEKQIQKLFLQAKKFNGKFDENFIKIVESRLDVALFRIAFFPTIFCARQWINHKHILVNNSVINLPGYQLKSGDVITVAPDKRDALKRRICDFLAEKIKIRDFHYLLRIKTFYTIIKNCTFLRDTQSVKIKEKPLETQNKIRFKKMIRKITGTFSSLNRIEKCLPKIFSFFSQKRQQLLPFLKIRNLFTSARPLRQRVGAFKISGMKPLNLEVCYKNMVAIVLYSPQKVALPASIDLHLIAKTIQ